MSRRVLAAVAVGAALTLPTVVPAVATAAPSYSECVDMYGYQKTPREINPKTGLPKFAQKRGPLTQEAVDCIKAGEMKHGNKHIPLKVAGVLGVIYLGGIAWRKWNGTPPTTLREDWQEMKDGLADAADAREQELAERAQREWERQQTEQPVYDYPETYTEPTYTEPAPMTSAPAQAEQSNDDDGWGL